jgi:hypothetical protein
MALIFLYLKILLSKKSYKLSVFRSIGSRILYIINISVSKNTFFAELYRLSILYLSLIDLVRMRLKIPLKLVFVVLGGSKVNQLSMG